MNCLFCGKPFTLATMKAHANGEHTKVEAWAWWLERYVGPLTAAIYRNKEK